MIESHFIKYNNLKDDIRYKNMELIKLKEDLKTLTGVSYDKLKVKGGVNITMEDKLHVIIEKEKQLQKLYDSYNELRAKHESEIDRIQDGTKRFILKSFYLDRCTIKEIAVTLEKSCGHIKKLKRWAVAEFERGL